MIKEAAGALLGIGINALGRKSQEKQQKRLQEQQIKGAKEMSDYEKANQMDMWKKTNYGAQVAELNKAGLNPALLYGMGGGGGATTGGGSGAMPTGGVAESPSSGTKSIMDMALMKAQTAVMESQARKNNVEADKTAGVDTEEKQISNKIKNVEAEVRERIGVDSYEKEERVRQEASNTRQAKEIREFEEWMTQAYTGDIKGETIVDSHGAYTRNENDLIREAQKAGIQEKIQTVSNLVKEYELKESQEKLNEIEAEIRGFKADLSKLGLNEQTTTILNTLLKAIFR